MSQRFFTYQQQVDKLMLDKMLSISDIDSAKKTLETLSYYSLIVGYKDLFKHAASGKFKNGVTFEEIVTFYYFDEELRILFWKYILHIERHIKSIISYYFSEKYGEKQQEYLNPLNYTVTKKNNAEVNKLIDSINKAISLPSRYSYITHHAKKYGNIPLWVAMNSLTFGQTSKFYQYIPNDVQYKICQKFPHITEREMHEFLTIIGRCRNICAHGERLFSFKIRETIPNTLIHKKMGIGQNNNQYICGKHDLFAVVISLKYLIEKREFKEFVHKLIKLINNLLENCPHIAEKQLLDKMGFPKNWTDIVKCKF